jgi:hypothetical protein
VTAEQQKLDATATLDFGMGVTVTKPVVVSDSTMIAHLAVDKAAKTGSHDVKITIGGKTLTGTGAFQVLAPMVVSPFPPLTSVSAGQGGIMLANLYNLEHTAWDPNAFNVTGPGLKLALQGVTATNALVGFLIDPLATAGATQLIGGNYDTTGALIGKSFLGDPAAATVTATTPVGLTPGTPKTGQNLAQQLATNLYSYPVTGPAIVAIDLANMGALLQAGMYVYPKSGVAADLVGAPSAGFFGPSPDADVAYNLPGAGMETHFAVMSDAAFGGGTAANYGYDINVRTFAATVATETNTAANSHATAATAQALTIGGPTIITGSLAPAETADVYSFAVANNDNWEITYIESPNSGSGICTDETGTTCNGVAIPSAGKGGSNAGTITAFTAAATWYVIVLPFVSFTSATNYSISLRKCASVTGTVCN